MIKQFLNTGSKVGDTKIIRHLIAILQPRDGSQSFLAKISKQVLKQVVRDWEDCYKSSIACDRDIPKFSCFPSIPQYKHKICTRNLFSSDNQAIQKRGINLNNGLRNLSHSDLIISTKSQDVIKVRVVPATALYFFEVANQKPVTLVDLNYHLRAGIDLGIDRLVGLASNKPTFTPTVYDQKYLKSINQGFNQREAFLLSKLDQGKSTTRQIQQITLNRNKRLKNYLHQTSSLIVKRLWDEKIIQLIIGTTVRNKQNLKLPKKQRDLGVIIQTPIVKLLIDQAELVGIKVIVTQAYYTTNNCCFGDLEPVGKQESYQGKIDKRGWFRFWNKSRINVDVNAALNMIRKVNVNSPP
ncbi:MULTISPECIES: transposase [unclassified Microcoleus]|uniref:transposase n=1 Tax=unclassified Microcoleus TaxID=2642155 RepID=UPI002FD16B38